jgi:hypothetical protein
MQGSGRPTESQSARAKDSWRRNAQPLQELAGFPQFFHRLLVLNDRHFGLGLAPFLGWLAGAGCSATFQFILRQQVVVVGDTADQLLGNLLPAQCRRQAARRGGY